jgi:hypothetical protein
LFYAVKQLKFMSFAVSNVKSTVLVSCGKKWSWQIVTSVAEKRAASTFRV